MSVQWSLAENDATFRGGSNADDDLLMGTGDKNKKDKGTQASGKAAPAKGSKNR